MAKSREIERQFWREYVHAWRRSGHRRDDDRSDNAIPFRLAPQREVYIAWVGTCSRL
jgi:hypothetical protein